MTVIYEQNYNFTDNIKSEYKADITCDWYALI